MIKQRAIQFGITKQQRLSQFASKYDNLKHAIGI